MSPNTQRNSLRAAIGSLGWPLIVGAASCSMFYVLILRGPLQSDLLVRYFTAHPVSYAATALVFIGLASLMFRLWDILGQYFSLNTASLPELIPGGQPIKDASDLLDDLEDWPARLQRSYFGRRIRDSLDFVERTGSSEGLRDELKFLNDAAEEEQHESYSLARIVIWATPMLGFLGTVIGITTALGSLDSAELAASPKTAMDKLLSGLYVAFDTTTLALSLSLISMFVKFFVERLETNLLRVVEHKTDQEIIGRFDAPSSYDPNVVAIRRMAEEVVDSTEQLAIRQAEIWQASIEAAHGQWSELVGTAGDELQDSLAQSLRDSLSELREELKQSNETMTKSSTEQWERWQAALNDSTSAMREQQEEMVKQGVVMNKALEATSDVIKLETALNQNLRSLAGAKHFEDTVMSLSAAIHLLNSRLGAVETPAAIDLSSGDKAEDQDSTDAEEQAA